MRSTRKQTVQFPYKRIIAKTRPSVSVIPAMLCRASPNDYSRHCVSCIVHPHTLTALALLLAWLFYAAVRTTYENTETSVKLGISAAAGCFVFIGMLQFRDGPFIRPSVPFWRAVLSLSVLYQMLLVFLLFLVHFDLIFE